MGTRVTKELTLGEAYRRIERLEKILADQDANAPLLGRADPPPPKPQGCVCPPKSEETCRGIMCPRKAPSYSFLRGPV